MRYRVSTPQIHEPNHLVSFLPTENALTSVRAHEDISKRFDIPTCFWTSLALDASGFFRSQEDRDENGALKCYSK
jgi:hypothetical protein